MATQTINPYTFIPLISGKNNNNDFEGKKLSGVVNCSLMPKTPIAIPDTENHKDGEPYEFFNVKLGDNPKKYLIPGSSIRGSVRSVYEALTDSCLRTNDNFFHLRNSKPKDPGILHYDIDTKQYVLFEAKRYKVIDNSFNELKSGQKVNFTIESDSKVSKIREGDKGLYLNPNRFGKGEKCSKPSVFVNKNIAVNKDIDDIYIKCLDENINLYDLEQRGTNKGKQKIVGREYRKAFDKMIKGEGDLPVFYSIGKNGSYEFAPSQISRDVYPITPQNKINGYDVCTDVDNCCPACSLFGFVSENESKASRLRFSDAKAICEVSVDEIRLPILLGPKMSAFEFYLRNDSNLFNFSVFDDDTNLSGRKMYWHHPNLNIDKFINNNSNRDDLQDTMEVVTEGKFIFNIYFDDIFEEELNTLLYSLNLGSSWRRDNKEYCLKIGHGNPIGLGSVKIDIDGIYYREYYKADNNTQNMPYKIIAGRDIMMQGDDFVKNIEHSKIISNNYSIIKTVLDFNTIPTNKVICYPRLSWFSSNRNLNLRKDKYNEILKNKGNFGFLLNPKLRRNNNYEIKRKSNKKTKYLNNQKKYNNKRKKR